MEFRVRTAKPEDAEAIAWVHVESWRTTYKGIVPRAYLDRLDVLDRTQMWREALERRRAALFVAEGGEGVFGFCCGGGIRDAMPGYDGELYAIYVLGQQQGSGAGRRLTEALEASLRHDGLERCVAWVLEENPAVGFYRRLGGVKVGEKRIEIGGKELIEVAYGWPIGSATIVAES